MKFLKKKQNEDELEIINLVGGLLLCFPMMSKITLDPKEKGIVFAFAFKNPPDKETFKEDCKFIRDSLQLYNQLEGIRGGKCGICYEDCSLQIFRDWNTISKQEIELMVRLVTEKYGDLFSEDCTKNLDTEATVWQSHVIDSRLEILKNNPIKKRIVGLCGDDRIMVFDNEK